MSQFSEDLLAQSAVLARSDAKKPKQANLKRAVSAAYYALFHFLIDESSRQVTGSGAGKSSLRNLASRAYDHGKMKAVLDEMSKQTPRDLLKPFWTSLNIAASKDLKTVADAFADLQELRHQADYDLTISFSRQEAKDAHDTAQQAMKAWRKLKTNHADIAELVSLLLLIWPLIERRK